MDNALSVLFSWQFWVFCLAVYAITEVIRRVCEYLFDNYNLKIKKTSDLWREVILPIMPTCLGGLAAFCAYLYPYPEGMTSLSGRIGFGLVAGLVSGLAYRILKSKAAKLITAAGDKLNSK